MSAYDEGHLIAEVILGCNKYVDKVIVMGDCSSDRAVEVWAELQSNWSLWFYESNVERFRTTPVHNLLSN